MKVEFSESVIWGAQLLVTASEFKKALKNDIEFDSLAHATTAFAKLFDVDYEIDNEEYSSVIHFLGKDGLVIFMIGEARYPDRRWVEILIVENNQLSKICWTDDDGYHLKKPYKQGKFDPKAIDRIRKRHEEEKKHE